MVLLSFRSISVAIEEIEKENWMKDVYDKEIMKNQKILYKNPEY